MLKVPWTAPSIQLFLNVFMKRINKFRHSPNVAPLFSDCESSTHVLHCTLSTQFRIRVKKKKKTDNINIIIVYIIHKYSQKDESHSQYIVYKRNHTDNKLN